MSNQPLDLNSVAQFSQVIHQDASNPLQRIHPDVSKETYLLKLIEDIRHVHVSRTILYSHMNDPVLKVKS